MNQVPTFQFTWKFVKGQPLQNGFTLIIKCLCLYSCFWGVGGYYISTLVAAAIACYTTVTFVKWQS